MKRQATMIPGWAPGGAPMLSVLAKSTYEFGPGTVVPAFEQLPLTVMESTVDPQNPLYSETIDEPDLVPFKPFTDFVVLGKAWAPRGKKAYRLECSVHVGRLVKKMTVHGRRTLETKMMRGLSFSDPVPFESREIGYAHAFGGRAVSKEGTLFPFPPNPIGTGFSLKGGVADPAQIVVPHCEDPASPIEPDQLIVGKYEDWVHCPKPVSFGWTKQGFYPRYTYAGVLPDMLAGALGSGAAVDPRTPKLDFRFYQGASEGLGEHLLAGNESVTLNYLDPDYPRLEFSLPGDTPSMVLTIGGKRHDLQPSLQTVVVNTAERLLTMVWRGSCAYGGVDELSKTVISYEVA